MAVAAAVLTAVGKRGRGRVAAVGSEAGKLRPGDSSCVKKLVGRERWGCGWGKRGKGATEGERDGACLLAPRLLQGACERVPSRTEEQGDE